MVLGCCFHRQPEPKIRSSSLQSSRSKASSGEYPWEIYTLKEIIGATHNFNKDKKLGEGGFGTVYYGRTGKGEEIAVKRLKTMTPKAEMEFAVEVEILGRVRHKNLLGLRGYYAGGTERLIVYDYMPNQSLLSHLHGQLAGKVKLDWARRMSIMIGSAEGLAHLHHEATPHIIHRDIKASNVLLDSSYRAKVADFGFAKLIPDGVSHVTTKVKGTLGYMAPEYAMWGKVSESCDVYSFGILLLEIVSARKPIEKLEKGVRRDIVQWATPLVERGSLQGIVDLRLGDEYDGQQARNAVIVAMRCVDVSPDNRPTMREVVELLKGGTAARRTKEVIVNKGESEEEEIEDGTKFAVDSQYIRRNMKKLNAKIVMETQKYLHL